MDLSKIDGLTEEQQQALSSMFEESTQGLKNKVDELLGEKKTAAQKAVEAEQQAEEARKLAAETKKQQLANEGKFEELKKLHEKEIAEARAQAEQKAELAQQSLDQLHKGTALNGALSLIHDDYKPISEAMLSNMIKVSYNEDNQPITAFEYKGETVAKNVDEFKSWALTQDSFKNILNGVDSSGAGATNSGGASGSNAQDADFTQRLKQSGLI